MDPGPRSRAPTAPGGGTELWLLVPGSREQLEARLQAFARTEFALVLAAPGAPEREWAEAFARARGLAARPAPELAAGAHDEPFAARVARAWPAFEFARAHGHPRALLVQPQTVLLALFARALDLALEQPPRVRVEPGHGVLLRDDPLGLVLRRSNVRAPLESSGTALPTPKRRP